MIRYLALFQKLIDQGCFPNLAGADKNLNKSSWFSNSLYNRL
jgi:hypothetical protein